MMMVVVVEGVQWMEGLLCRGCMLGDVEVGWTRTRCAGLEGVWEWEVWC